MSGGLMAPDNPVVSACTACRSLTAKLLLARLQVEGALRRSPPLVVAPRERSLLVALRRSHTVLLWAERPLYSSSPEILPRVVDDCLVPLALPLLTLEGAEAIGGAITLQEVCATLKSMAQDPCFERKCVHRIKFIYSVRYVEVEVHEDLMGLNASMGGIREEAFGGRFLPTQPAKDALMDSGTYNTTFSAAFERLKILSTNSRSPP
ncbi:hypothetical protein NDU88_009201 [Pleurodeles waltl]|uniref:Uncharacterized protein n=1 Tax=Pleurodeles waltl TaxID=8319 RepID=A0AAV7QR05_PLEWA|nr:hypothetical protein NDU88_009201 [Pleurodeles waltl]